MNVNVIFIVIYKKYLNTLGITRNVSYIDLEKLPVGMLYKMDSKKNHLRKNTRVDRKQPLVLSLKK